MWDNELKLGDSFHNLQKGKAISKFVCSKV